MPITMMRSRFQPFTKGHYEAIRSYYLARKEKPNLPEKLVLCIIRDFDVVRMARPRVGDKLITGNETEEELALLFRHLDFFNPFSAYEVIERIWDSLRCFAAEDELTYCDSQYEKFVDNIGVVLCPLKFGELLDALRREDFTPRHLERHVNNVRNRVLEVLRGQENVDSSLQKELERAFEESKKELIDNVLNTWARFTRDLLPRELHQIYWLMPIFDQEDLADFNKLKELGFSAYYLIMDQYKYECIPDLLGQGWLGLYGLFIQYVLLRLVEEGIIRPSVVNPMGGWAESIQAQMNALSNLLCPHSREQYIGKVNDKIAIVNGVLEIIQDGFVHNLLCKHETWSEKLVQELQEAGAGPYFVLVVFVNILARAHFSNVAPQIHYPPENDIEKLDDQFKIPLQSMSGNIVDWFQSSISSHKKGQKLTKGQRNALARAERLAEAIKKRDLENQIRQDETCLHDCRKLAEAVRDLRVEDINQLVTRIKDRLEI